MDPRVFFPAGPPHFAPAPSDQNLEIRIRKLAEYASRNGPAFIHEVRAKQSHNPEFAFLHGGEGAAYFSWVLHCNLIGQYPTPPPPMHSQPPHPRTHPHSMMHPTRILHQPFPPQGPPNVPHGTREQPWPPPLHSHHHHPPQPPPRPPQKPEEPPFDPFSFPPGLIPRLVDENLHSQIPYSPLNPSNISKSDIPPPPTLDPYLKARLDKFYAQLDGYKAGIEFCDIEGGGEPPIPRDSTHSIPTNTTTAPYGRGRGGRDGVNDGSGGFRATDGGRGLGYGDTTGIGGGDRDAFSSYRARSSYTQS